MKKERTLADIELLKARVAETTTFARRMAASRDMPRALEVQIKEGNLSLTFPAGTTLSFPAQAISCLEGLGGEQIQDVRLVSNGQMLMWPQAGQSISVNMIIKLALRINQLDSREMGALGGSVKTQAKASASRANGAKGGRPRKMAA